MPKYLYQVIDENGNAKEIVELEHGMNESLTKHPQTGETLIRLYTSFSIGGAQNKSSSGLGEVEYDMDLAAIIDVPDGTSFPVQTDQGTINLESGTWEVCKAYPHIPGLEKNIDPSLN